MAYRGGSLVPFGMSFGPLFGLRRDIDRLFDDAFGNRSGSELLQPAVNIREAKDELCIDMELPGIEPGQVDITVENGMLTVAGEKREERKEDEEEGRYHLVERRYGSFARSFQLPQGVSEDQIGADFHNGILTVRIPKAALPQARKIQIGRGASGDELSGQAPTVRRSAGGTTPAAGGAGSSTPTSGTASSRAAGSRAESSQSSQRKGSQSGGNRMAAQQGSDRDEE